MKYYDEKHNKFFDTEKQYNEYQEKLTQEEKQREDLKRSKQARLDEISKTYNRLVDLCEQYGKDYEESILVNGKDLTSYKTFWRGFWF